MRRRRRHELGVALGTRHACRRAGPDSLQETPRIRNDASTDHRAVLDPGMKLLRQVAGMTMTHVEASIEERGIRTRTPRPAPLKAAR